MPWTISIGVYRLIIISFVTISGAHLADNLMMASAATSTSAMDEYSKGLKLYESGNLTSAEPLMRAIMTVEPEKPELEAKYAYLLNDLQRYDDAIKIFQHVLSIDPNLPGSQERLGDAYLCTGRFAQAEAQYRKFLESVPDDVDSWNNLSVVLNQQHKLEEGKKAAERATRLNPNDHKGWDNLGAAETLLGNFEAAIKAYDQALFLDPKRPDAQKVRDILSSLKASQGGNVKSGSSEKRDALQQKNAFRWSVNAPLKVCILSPNEVPHYKPEYAELLKQSFKEWSAASNEKLRFEFIPDPVLADILVRYSAAPKDWIATNEQGHCSTFTSHGVPDKAAITLLTVSNVDNVPLSDDNAHRTALHEIGHALGISDHSKSQKDVMYAFVEPGAPPVLSEGDQHTIQQMYGADSSRMLKKDAN